MQQKVQCIHNPKPPIALIEQYMHYTVSSLIFFLLQQKVCHRYWPKFQGEASTYGDFTVTQQTFDAYGDYVVRKLSVAMAASDEPPSVVTQFHFTRWTEKDPPQSPATILDVVQEVNAVQMASGNKPIVVMCK